MVGTSSQYAPTVANSMSRCSLLDRITTADNPMTHIQPHARSEQTPPNLTFGCTTRPWFHHGQQMPSLYDLSDALSQKMPSRCALSGALFQHMPSLYQMPSLSRCPLSIRCPLASTVGGLDGAASTTTVGAYWLLAARGIATIGLLTCFLSAGSTTADSTVPRSDGPMAT